MLSDLDHLPERNRRDLERIVEILFAEFRDATSLATQGWKKQGRVLKIVLFGSFARGDWVADPKGGYFSDYDILVVVSDRRLTDTLEFWAKADDHLMRAVTIEKLISAPVNFIVHDLADVNEQLRHGRPFFVDIARDGIALYRMEGCTLSRRILSREQSGRLRPGATSKNGMTARPGFSIPHNMRRVEKGRKKPLFNSIRRPNASTTASCWC